MGRNQRTEDVDSTRARLQALLARYDASDVRLFVDDLARWEQHLPALEPPLRPSERKFLRSLLEPETRDGALDELLERPRRGRLLQLPEDILRRPGLIQGGQYSRYPYVEATTDNVTVLIQQIEVGLTGIRIHAAVRIVWQGSEVIDQPHGVIVPEWGIETIEDDRGTVYGLGGGSNQYSETHTVIDGVRQTRVVILGKSYWMVGPPPEAQRLVITPETSVGFDDVQEALDSPDRWKQVDVPLKRFEVTLWPVPQSVAMYKTDLG